MVGVVSLVLPSGWEHLPVGAFVSCLVIDSGIEVGYWCRGISNLWIRAIGLAGRWKCQSVNAFAAVSSPANREREDWTDVPAIRLLECEKDFEDGQHCREFTSFAAI